MNEFHYVGSELEIFSAARNWKSYWSGLVRPYVAGDTVEVGAGIGANTPYLDGGGERRWVCVEPDRQLTARLGENLARAGSRAYEVVCGTVRDLQPGQFDTVIYIDVLEHIEDDRAELAAAVALLRPGGRVIVLSPAHQSLFTPFDAAIGHFRRYDRAMLRALAPPGAVLERIWFMDSAGMLLSAANRLILRQSMPTRAQIAFWDRCIIPVSRMLDPCLLRSVGKSLVGVWRRER